MHIALDVEGVLAEIHKPAWDEMGLDDVDSWGFENPEQRDQFHEITQEMWEWSPLDIEPCEPYLGHHVERMRQAGHTVDIVTHRFGVDEQIQSWLQHHNIPYNEFLTPKSEKLHTPHDAYIDDKPKLAELVDDEPDMFMFLVDRPYNRNIDVNGYIYRVDGVGTTADELEQL
jgi:hypothetical protein